MTMKQKELYNVIEKLPEELLVKALDYIEYLKFSTLTNQIPEEITVKDENELIEKLEEGIRDFENGNVCSIEQAYSEVQQLLTD